MLSEFDRVFLNLPNDIRCHEQGINDNTGKEYNFCVFGVPSKPWAGRKRILKIPDEVNEFHFLMGQGGYDLIFEFAHSNYVNKVEVLCIGDSCYTNNSGVDYRDITGAIEKVTFPKLKSLSLGIWELYSNSHCMYGKIGNVTRLLQNNHMIIELDLGGHFELDDNINLDKLTNLSVQLDDQVTGINGGLISQNTLNHLLGSFYPALECLYLDLRCDDENNKNESGYICPDDFLSGKNFPSLKACYIGGGFAKGQKYLLLNSVLTSKVERFSSDIIEL